MAGYDIGVRFNIVYAGQRRPVYWQSVTSHTVHVPLRVAYIHVMCIGAPCCSESWRGTGWKGVIAALVVSTAMVSNARLWIIAILLEPVTRAVALLSMDAVKYYNSKQ